jgi:class 3 adenylate cyclase
VADQPEPSDAVVVGPRATGDEPELEQLRRQQRAVSDVLAAVARSEGLQVVFEAVVDAASQLGGGGYGALYLADGNSYRPAVVRDRTPEQLEWERSHPHVVDRTTLTGRVVLSRSVVHIPDVLADREYDWPMQASVGYRSLLGVPIMAGEELVGVLGVARHQPAPFSADEIAIVRTFADQAAIAIVNARLLDAVERQRVELARFVSPQVADLLSSDDGLRMLAGHRAYVTVLFADLRGFTAFVETAAPEELLEVLRQYHELVGGLMAVHGATLEHFAGDGVMGFFNDPLPMAQHELQAVRLALDLQARFAGLAGEWRKRGTQLGLGIGIAAGHATVGQIGTAARHEYGALGPVTNLAARLSGQARAGQILISQRVLAAVEDDIDVEPVGSVELKGFSRPVETFEVRGLR